VSLSDYLWGIETLLETASHEPPASFQTTYEELKHYSR